MPTQFVAEPQVSMHTASASHWNVQPPPAQSKAHFEPALQSTTQLPPAHDPSQVAPDSHVTWHPPRAQVGEHVPPAHVKEHPPAGHAGAQLVLHPQPASALAVEPHAGSADASGPAAPAPASGIAQSLWNADRSRTAAHCVSSAEARAC